jgi:hypothetical protein
MLREMREEASKEYSVAERLSPAESRAIGAYDAYDRIIDLLEQR